MGETTNQIENHIENKREDLQSNLQELESKVKSATDWRQYVQKRPGTMVAAAFGGGMLISAMMGKHKRGDASAVRVASLRANTGGRRRDKNEVLETWDTIKSALVGVAATRFKGMLGEVVPGFSAQVAQSESRKSPQATAGRSAETIVEG